MAQPEITVCRDLLSMKETGAVLNRWKEISVLKKMALDSPRDREAILRMLEEYESSGTPESKAASRAIGTILAASMLEILCGE